MRTRKLYFHHIVFLYLIWILFYLIVLRNIILCIKVSNIYTYIIICTCIYDWNNTGYILMKCIQVKHDILQHYSYEVFWKKKYVCLDAWNSKPSLYHSCTSQFIFKWLSLQSKFLKPILFPSLVYQIIYEPECLRTDSSLIKCFLVLLQKNAVKKRVCLVIKQKDVSWRLYTWVEYKFCVV